MKMSGSVEMVFVLKYPKNAMGTLIVRMAMMNWIAVSSY